MKRLIPIVLVIFASAAHAGEGLRMRARERWQSGRYDAGDGNGASTFRGFASAVDVWHEKPFEWSAGLTVQRGSLKEKNTDARANQTTLGVEGKYFLIGKEAPAFVRGGLLAEAMDRVGGDPARWAPGLSASAGWEFPIGKVGIAPEAGFRAFWGASGRRHTAPFVAIGVHFYKIGE